METKILGLLRTATPAAGLSVMASFGAHAMTVTSTVLTVADLNAMTPQANPLATSTTGTVYENATVSVDGVRRSPWQGSNYNLTGAVHLSQRRSQRHLRLRISPVRILVDLGFAR